MSLIEFLSLADLLSFAALAFIGIVVWKLTHPPSKDMPPHLPPGDKDD